MSRKATHNPAFRSTIIGLAVCLLAGCSGSPEERAQSYFAHGKQLLAQHDSKRAEIEFLNAVKYDSKLLAAWKSLGDLQESNKNWRGLAGTLHNVLELDPGDLTARLKLGRLELIGGAYNDALNLVNDVKAPEDQSPELLALKAAILLKLNDSVGARAIAHKALAADPSNIAAMVVLASDDLAHGDSKGALAIVEDQAFKSKPASDVGIELFKLRILEQAQDLRGAEAQLHKLIDQYPKELSLSRELVRLYLFEHRNDDAVSAQRAVAEAEPKDAQAQLDLVRLLGATEGVDAARQQLTSLIKAGGDAFAYQIALAQLDYGSGRFPDSVALLESLTKDNSAPNNAIAAQLELAQMYLSKGKVDQADALVSDVLRKDGRNIAGLKLHASIEMQRGKFEDAVSALRQALNDQPRGADLMLMLAAAYERSGSVDLAEKEYADAMQTSNHNPAVTLNYVAFLQRRGNIAHADDVLTDLATRWPQNIQVLSALGQIRLMRQDWAGAQEVAQSIKRLSSDHTLADQMSGEALAGQGKFAESLSVLQNAYQEQPKATQPMFALVRTYLRAKEPQKAITFLQSVLKASPDNAVAYVLLGNVQQAEKHLDQAKQSFETAIQKQPATSIGYRGLFEFYAQQGDFEEALKVARGGLKQVPDDPMLHLALAAALEHSGDYEGAIAEYQGLIKKDPGSITIANNLASLLADHRNDKASFDQAEALSVVLQKSPVPQFSDTLGWVRYRQRDYKSAAALLEQAAKELPNDPAVHYHLAMTYRALGQTDKANEQLKTALALSPIGDLKQKIAAQLAKNAAE